MGVVLKTRPLRRKIHYDRIAVIPNRLLPKRETLIEGGGSKGFVPIGNEPLCPPSPCGAAGKRIGNYLSERPFRSVRLDPASMKHDLDVDNTLFESIVSAGFQRNSNSSPKQCLKQARRDVRKATQWHRRLKAYVPSVRPHNLYKERAGPMVQPPLEAPFLTSKRIKDIAYFRRKVLQRSHPKAPVPVDLKTYRAQKRYPMSILRESGPYFVGDTASGLRFIDSIYKVLTISIHLMTWSLYNDMLHCFAISDVVNACRPLVRTDIKPRGGLNERFNRLTGFYQRRVSKYRCYSESNKRNAQLKPVMRLPAGTVRGLNPKPISSEI
jgi:hypothetical protein